MISFHVIMSDRMKRNMDFLTVLARCNKKQRQAILEHCDKDLILVICELAINTLKGVVKLTPSQKARLRRFRKQLRTLADRQVPLKHKKHSIVQSGGSILLSLLPPAISLLTSLFSSK